MFIQRSLTLIFLLLQYASSQSFKEEQLRFPRVKSAFTEKSAFVDSLLKKYHLQKNGLNIFLRAFKNEKSLEVWGKNRSDEQYRLINKYRFCETSGGLGPKRMEGDGQIPEGIYTIDMFNPHSNFHLSLGISYPNRSDALLGMKGKLGGEIFIHGNCVTIGCIPITDDKIKELYIFAVEAKNAGQSEIPVHIYPSRMDDSQLKALTEYKKSDTLTVSLWNNLAPVFQDFEATKRLKAISIDSQGRYQLHQ